MLLYNLSITNKLKFVLLFSYSNTSSSLPTKAQKKPSIMRTPFSKSDDTLFPHFKAQSRQSPAHREYVKQCFLPNVPQNSNMERNMSDLTYVK